MKNLALLILCAVTLRADPITITLTLDDNQQAAYARVQSRESDTNLVTMPLTNYVANLLMQSVVGVQKQEANADDQVILQAIKTAKPDAKAFALQSIGVDASTLISQPAPTPVLTSPPISIQPSPLVKPTQ